MKKIIPSFIFLVFAIIMCTFNIYAGSNNSAVLPYAIVRPNMPINNANIQIVPRNQVYDGDSIYLTLQNGRYSADIIESNPYISTTGKTYDELCTEVSQGTDIKELLLRELGENTNELPYKIEYVNEREVRVWLFPLPEYCANEKDVICPGRPYYIIPILAISGNEYSSITVYIDDNATSITGGSNIKIGEVRKGNLDLNIDSYNLSPDNTHLDIPELTVSENFPNIFKKGSVLTFTLPNGFIYDTTNTNISLKAGDNAIFPDVAYGASLSNIRYSTPTQISVNIPNGIDILEISSLKLCHIKIQRTNNNYNWSDFYITVSHIGIKEKIYIQKYEGTTETTTQAQQTNAFCAITKRSSLKVGEPLDGSTALVLSPKCDIGINDYILISIDNAVFDLEKWSTDSLYGYIYYSVQGYSYDDMLTRYLSTEQTYDDLKSILLSQLGVNTNELPYKIEYVDSHTIKVYLYPIFKDFCNNDEISVSSPYYLIPLPAMADNPGDMTVKISSGTNNPIYENTLKIATVYGPQGGIVASTLQIPSFNGSHIYNRLTLDFPAGNTLKKGAVITVTLNDDFKFDTSVVPNINSTAADDFIGNIKTTEQSISFTVMYDYNSKYSKIYVCDFGILPTDLYNSWGDVKATAALSGVGSSTVLIANRQPIDLSYGDSDADGVITAADASIIMQLVLNKTFDTGIAIEYNVLCDVDCDGILTSNDAALILQKSLNGQYQMPIELL